MIRRLFLSLAVLLALALPAQAQNFPVCGPQSFIFQVAGSSYGENVSHVAVRSNNDWLVILVHPETGTFTVTFTDSIKACVFFWGTGWQVDLSPKFSLYSGDLNMGPMKGKIVFRVNHDGSWAVTFPSSEKVDGQYLYGTNWKDTNMAPGIES